MLKNLKEILRWLRGEDEAYTPADAPVAGLMRLVALSAMASVAELKQRQEDEAPASPDSDEAPAPSEGANGQI
ncbi:MAG: hypothetical protein KDD02_11300 [Phaeodactylibacter sp.]|nr:hypothetical protein [Phaeodactylibacter sp.]MCB9302436.1 hypothetical protein [Lewinellaceae bacterium]